MGGGSPQTYRILKFVVASFGLHPILRDLCVTSLINAGGLQLSSRVGPRRVICATDFKTNQSCAQFKL